MWSIELLRIGNIQEHYTIQYKKNPVTLEYDIMGRQMPRSSTVSWRNRVVAGLLAPVVVAALAVDAAG